MTCAALILNTMAEAETDESLNDVEMNPASFDYIYKILVIGNSGVGKTSFLSRYFDKVYKEQPGATVGVDFRHRNFKRNGKRMQLQIWDTAGQERYQSLTTAYFRGATGVMIMFDLTNRTSFEACQSWIDKANDATGEKDFLMLLIGNKVDCCEEDRQVAQRDGQRLAGDLDIQYFESSAKENVNVSEVIEYLLNNISKKAVEVNHSPEYSMPISQLISKPESSKETSCC